MELTWATHGGYIPHEHKNIEIVEVDGVKRVVRKRDKKIMKARLDSEVVRGRHTYDF